MPGDSPTPSRVYEGELHVRQTVIDTGNLTTQAERTCRMENSKAVSVSRACPGRSHEGGDESNNPKFAGIRPSAQVLHQLIARTFFFSRSVCIVLNIVATTQLGMISAQSVDSFSKFSVVSSNYSCSSNLICLGEAHGYSTGDDSNGIEVGMLSLLYENCDNNASRSVDSKGVAYYKEPVKLLDLSTKRPASFNTSFAIYMRYGQSNSSYDAGDGMAFVMSADNLTVGGPGANFGIFSQQNSATSFKSIVLEFDSFWNDYPPVNDISGNHVSLDMMNITWMAAANASDVNVALSEEFTVYAWVEYSTETEQLEVRISYVQSRPVRPLLKYTVNLFDHVEEFMWVGFSSGSGTTLSSNYYVGNWTFESYGSLTPISTPTKHENKHEINVLSSPPLQKTSSGAPNRGRTLEISVAIPCFLLGCVVIAFLVCTYRYRHSCARRPCLWFSRFGAESEGEISIEGMPERFSYKQLSMATRHFNEASKLGQGGFGNVYRGALPSSGIPMAVKKIKRDSAQGQKEFMAEISIISQLRHRNLIQLLGWCKDVAREKYLLVYEFMPNGSLDKALFGPPGRSNGKEITSLSWQQRLNIVTGTAAALEYLHQGWRQQVIHRDIKPSNIMLDGEWNPKLGDFGLARLVDHQRAATTTAVAGTYGYIAPEAAATGHFTDKTDVFAFGAVILEVACGRRALATYLPSEEMFLVDWVWQKLSEGALLSTVDKRLREYDIYLMEVVLILGLLCSHPNPLSRPSMRQVVEVLAGDIPVPSIPTFKPDPFSLIPQSSLKNDEHFLDRKARSISSSTCGISTNISNSSGTDTGKASKSTVST